MIGKGSWLIHCYTVAKWESFAIDIVTVGWQHLIDNKGENFDF